MEVAPLVEMVAWGEWRGQLCPQGRWPCLSVFPAGPTLSSLRSQSVFPFWSQTGSSLVPVPTAYWSQSALLPHPSLYSLLCSSPYSLPVPVPILLLIPVPTPYCSQSAFPNGSSSSLYSLTGPRPCSLTGPCWSLLVPVSTPYCSHTVSILTPLLCRSHSALLTAICPLTAPSPFP